MGGRHSSYVEESSDIGTMSELAPGMCLRAEFGGATPLSVLPSVGNSLCRNFAYDTDN